MKPFYSERRNRLFNKCEKFTYLSTLSFNDGSKKKETKKIEQINHTKVLKSVTMKCNPESRLF